MKASIVVGAVVIGVVGALAGQAAARQTTWNGADASSSTPSAEAAQVAATAAKNRATYDSGKQELVLHDGTTMKMSEMAPDYSASKVGSLQGINRQNVNQVAQQANEQQQGANGISGQAYRTSLSGMATSQRYVTDPSQMVVINGERRDPRDVPGIASLTPSVYFVSPSRDVVVVAVTLTGGDGPALVAYQTGTSDLPSGSFSPVQGQLVWHSGEQGTKTFVVPVNNAFMRSRGIEGGSIQVQLTGADGATLATNTTGRIVLGSGVFTGYSVAGCGTAGAPACQNPTGFPPVVDQQGSGSQHVDDGCEKPGHPGNDSAGTGTVSIECR